MCRATWDTPSSPPEKGELHVHERRWTEMIWKVAATAHEVVGLTNVKSGSDDHVPETSTWYIIATSGS
jgi:hypothetical protein